MHSRSGARLVVGPDFTQKRGKFFVQVFGRHEGYLCIARKHQSSFEERFFEYPGQLDDALEFIDKSVPTHDLYFCAQLLTQRKRIKENIRDVALLWADLDPCPPDKMLVAPSISIETSEGRYQALWRLEEPIDAYDAEEFCKRIYYWHKEEGVDSGWALTKLLRVPFSFNFKYSPPLTVKVIDARPGYYSVEDFASYKPIPGAAQVNGSVPTTIATGAEVLERERNRLSDRVFILFRQEPDESQKEGWSGALWALINECAEAGLALEDTFAVARDSACNKYERDGRPIETLWKEVQKVYAKLEAKTQAYLASIPKPSELIDPNYKQPDSFVQRYIEWAKQQTDAPEVYHQAGAFMILSASLSGMITLPVSFNKKGMKLNLWFFLLSDTTLSRKSTTLDMAVDLLGEVTADAIVATEATIEGLFATMAARAGKPSIFLRDEFSGMLDQMQRKDYYAGMPELLTKLYDGRPLTRQLAKSNITISDPLLIMYIGGAKSRIFELLTEDYVRSGFLPRFLFFSAEVDVNNLRPLGPPTEDTDMMRDTVVEELQAITSKYHVMDSLKIGNSSLPPRQRIWTAQLEPDAWKRYNALEETLNQDGAKSREIELVTPMYQRLAISILKTSVLIAACRPENPANEQVVVTEDDVEHAISYGARWRDSAMEVLVGAGSTSYESMLKRVMTFVQARGQQGVLRSQAMRAFKLSAKDADGVFATLIGRALIRPVRQGNDLIYFGTGI